MIKKLLLLVSILGVCSQVFAQSCSSDRYLNPIFNSSRTDNIKFADALGIVYPPYVGEGYTTDEELFFDLYQPDDDVMTKRPLLIMAFGGSFLAGSKRQAELVDYCYAMADRGFVVAAIDYRIGFGIQNSGSAVRAVYRAGQDIRTAVRYFKGNAATYGIDSSLVFTGGNSAGAIAALNAAYVEEIERETGDLFQPTFFQDNVLAPDWPDLGCIDCSGGSGTFPTPSQVLGKPKAIVNLWGAMGDLSFINYTTDQPVISFHGNADDVVNIGVGPPYGLGAIFPTLYGLEAIHPHLDALGIYNEYYIFDGVGHEVWEDPTHAAFIKEKSAAFLYKMMKPEATPILGNISPIVTCTETYSVSPRAGSIYCWNVNGGMIVSSTATSIDVEWSSTGTGTVSVQELDCHEVLSDWSDLEITIQECQAPVANNIEVISGNVVKISWDDVACAEKYRLRYRIPNVTSWQEVATNVNYRFLNELLPNTTYQYQLKAKCDDENSSIWAGNFNLFITGSTVCDRPISLGTTINSATAATINWDTDPDDVKYKVKYKVAGGTWIEVFVNQPLLVLTGLETGAVYKYKLKTKCPDGWTNWGDKYDFNLPASINIDSARRNMLDETIRLYPNPVQASLIIELSRFESGELYLYNAMGKLIQTTQISTSKYELNTEQLPTGLYYLKIRSNSNEIQIKEFIKF